MGTRSHLSTHYTHLVSHTDALWTPGALYGCICLYTGRCGPIRKHAPLHRRQRTSRPSDAPPQPPPCPACTQGLATIRSRRRRASQLLLPLQRRPHGSLRNLPPQYRDDRVHGRSSCSAPSTLHQFCTPWQQLTLTTWHAGASSHSRRPIRVGLKRRAVATFESTSSRQRHRPGPSAGLGRVRKTGQEGDSTAERPRATSSILPFTVTKAYISPRNQTRFISARASVIIFFIR